MSVRWALALLVLGGFVSAAPAGVVTDRFDLARVNRHLHGRVEDYTCNHGQDHRLWSPALCEKRDLYVYLPPCYDPRKKYPLALWLHMAREDESDFLSEMVETFDQAIACGQLPPMIIAAPDGSFTGKPPRASAGSFFINSKAGRFEDYIIQDVVGFVTAQYSVRPDRESHVLMGASMGGFGAFNLGIKYREQFKIVAGFIPSVNVRWIDCHGRYKSNFDPDCWGWRTQFPPREIVIWFRGFPVMLKHLTDPIFGRGPQLAEQTSRENPIEMLDAYDIKPGQLDLYIGYGGKDELNVDAQVESFLNVAQARGIEVGVGYLPRGRHSVRTVYNLFPDMARWLSQRLPAE